MDFFRFPHTPYLAWLGTGRPPRTEQVFSEEQARTFLSSSVTVEEKIDGANVGFSLDREGRLRVQNRGSFISPDMRNTQFAPLRKWMSERQESLVQTLGQDLILFGEWCYAVHSIRYNQLPDWFLAFDVYDRANNLFWNTARRDRLARRGGLALVPQMAVGKYDLDHLIKLLVQSKLASSPAEGLYIRKESEGETVSRA